MSKVDNKPGDKPSKKLAAKSGGKFDETGMDNTTGGGSRPDGDRLKNLLKFRRLAESYDEHSKAVVEAWVRLTDAAVKAANSGFTKYFGQAIYKYSEGGYVARVDKVPQSIPESNFGERIRGYTQKGHDLIATVARRKSPSLAETNSQEDKGQNIEDSSKWEIMGGVALSLTPSTIKDVGMFCFRFAVRGLELDLPFKNDKDIHSGWLVAEPSEKISRCMAKYMGIMSLCPQKIRRKVRADNDGFIYDSTYADDPIDTEADTGYDPFVEMSDAEIRQATVWIKEAIATSKRMKALITSENIFRFLFRYKAPDSNDIRIVLAGTEKGSLYYLLLAMLQDNFGKR